MIDDATLSSIVSRELAASETWMESDLADQQADSLRFYFGEKFGNEKAGFSQVVTRDVMEAIEGIMPELMKIFTSGDSFVEFEPQGHEDVEAAQQATDYINYIFQRRVDGFTILYNWFKDALLMKNGIVKTGWEDKEQVEIQNFKRLTKEQVKDLEETEDVEITSKEQQEDKLFDVTAARTFTKGTPFVEGIPSEEFKIKQRSKSIKDSDFVAHVTPKTVGDLIEAGFDEDDIQGAALAVEFPNTEVADARFGDPEERGSENTIALDHEKVVDVTDAYLRLFDSDDKRNKLWHVIQVGHTVLTSEEVEENPFISLSPIMVPHKFMGIGIADLVKDIQEIRSQLYRATLDNLALTNSGRYAVLENQVNLQDLIDNKIGGIVREKVGGAVRQLPTPQLGGATFPFLQELEQEKEDRVGVSKMTQGLDPNALTSNTAATAVNQVMTAAQQKILLIARVFAETGVKELFLHLYRLARTHQTEKDIVRLRGKFVEVNPFDWQNRYDMTVTVGIGNGNKDQQLFHLNNINNVLQAIGNTKYNYLITASNVHTLASEYIKNAGYKNVNSFISDPTEVQQPPEKPSAEMLAAQADMAKAQADVQKNQAEAQHKAGQLELDKQEFQLDVARFDWKKRIEAAELSVEAVQDRPVGIGTGQ